MSSKNAIWDGTPHIVGAWQRYGPEKIDKEL